MKSQSLLSRVSTKVLNDWYPFSCDIKVTLKLHPWERVGSCSVILHLNEHPVTLNFLAFLGGNDAVSVYFITPFAGISLEDSPHSANWEEMVRNRSHVMSVCFILIWSEAKDKWACLTLHETASICLQVPSLQKAAWFSINHDAKNIALEELLVVFNHCHHEVVGIFCLEQNILYGTSRNRCNYIQQNLTCDQ